MVTASLSARFLILKYLHEKELPVSTKDLIKIIHSEKLKITDSGIYKLIQKLRSEGLIDTQAKTKDGKIYTITKQGKDNIHEFDQIFKKKHPKIF
jgi:DNA-binding PadR family transcriptional regulator